MAETNGTAPEIAEPTSIPIPDEITSLIGEQQLQITFMRRELAALEQRNGALAAELQRVNALASEAGIELAPVEAPTAP